MVTNPLQERVSVFRCRDNGYLYGTKRRDIEKYDGEW